MIDQASGVEAYVAPYHPEDALWPYQEYLVPRHSPCFTGEANERYIEAVTDERFQMEVSIPSGFDFKDATHLQITYNIDRGVFKLAEHLQKPVAPNTSLQDSAASYVRRVDGKAVATGFKFGKLNFGMLIPSTRVQVLIR